MTDTTRAKLGSISHGTLRSADLIDAFSGALMRLVEAGTAHHRLAFNAVRAAHRIRRMEDADRHQEAGEIAGNWIDMLTDALNEYAPPYTYFGSHEGDGSDFGFWIDFEAVETDVQDGDLLKVSDLSEVPADWNGDVLLVNDHGNATLYTPNRTWAEVWSAV